MNEECRPDRKIEAACAGERASPADLPAADYAPEERPVGRPDVIVFYGDAEKVAAGFTLALEAMQAQDNLLRTDGKRGGNSR